MTIPNDALVEVQSPGDRLASYLLTRTNRSFLINCRDKRLQEILEKVFSSDLRFPSLKFTLVVSWFGFLGVCLVGVACDAMRLSDFSNAIKIFLLFWFGLMVAVLSPIFVLITNSTAATVALPFLASAVVLVLYQVSKFLRHPQALLFSFQGITATYPMFRAPSHLDWGEIDSVNLQQNNTANPENWVIVFKANGKEKLRIRNSTLLTSEERLGFIKAIEQNAPHAMLDAELVSTLSPISTSSYTELWLESLTAPPKRARLAPLEPGMTLSEGRYAITSVLATGGQGVVYCATDSKGSTSPESGERLQVVVKEIVLPVFGDANVRQKELQRFVNESQLLHRLNHPQIVKLFDFFIEDHRGYLVLEKIEGRSLAQIVEMDGCQSENRTRELAAQMCEILSYLHGLTPPLVHRDFTPDNLIVTPHNQLKLIDFNVACELNYTTTATIVGKRSFLPPEQFRGKPNIQSDIYALGCTLFFLLVGEEPEPISTSHPILIREEVSSELDGIVAKATNPDINDRYQNVEEVNRDLQGIPDLHQENSLLTSKE